MIGSLIEDQKMIKRVASHYKYPHPFHASVIVDLFWRANDHWFEEKNNSLYGHKERCHSFIDHWIEDRELPEPTCTAEVYLENKFNEWVSAWEPVINF